MSVRHLVALIVGVAGLQASSAFAANSCNDLVKLTELPSGFKTISRSALGPLTLEIESDGKCTCNDLPAVQRRLGQAEPEGINWACDKADAEDTRGK